MLRDEAVLGASLEPGHLTGTAVFRASDDSRLMTGQTLIVGAGLNQPDRFIIKIWAPGDDPDQHGKRYQASGDLGGGKIKIHN